MVRTAIQLYTLLEISDDLSETIAHVGTTDFEGVELAGLNGTPPAAIANALEESGLEAIGAHVSLERFEREYEAVVDAYDTIGCDRLIVPGDDAEAFQSREGLDALIDRLSTLSDRLADDGFELLYHNDAIEFGQIEDEVAYDTFVTATDGVVDFELDTGLAAYGGGDPIALLEEHDDRIPLIHLTDSVPGGSTTIQVELGAGELDVDRCVETAHDAGVEWVVYEHSLTSDPEGSLSHGAMKLSTFSYVDEIQSDFGSASTD